MHLPKGLSIIIAVAVLALGSAVFYFWDDIRYRGLASDLDWEDVLQKVYSAATPVPSSDEPKSESNIVPDVPQYIEEDQGVVVISTGEIYNDKLSNQLTGENIADASVLKVVTKDSWGLTESLEVVVQMTPNDDPNKNLAPWFAGLAEFIQTGSWPDNYGDVLTNEQLAATFPKGSEWVLMPIIDLENYFTSFSERQDYNFYVRRCLTDTSQLTDYLNSGLRKGYNELILLQGIDSGEELQW